MSKTSNTTLGNVEYVSFSPEDIERPSLNFHALRDQGLDYLQRFSGNNWTDFNAHDPGVTILEQLCYALTDVALRSSYDINDLLATGTKGKIDHRKNAFFSPSEIFRTHPITESDTKKLLLDHFSEIQNLWISYADHDGSAEKMVLTKSIDVLPKTIFHNQVDREDLRKRISIFVAQHRNLGEDVSKINLLEPKSVIIRLEVHLQSQKRLMTVMADLLLDLFEFIYRPVQKYSFEEASAASEAIDVFSGPKLKNGFINEDGLSDRLTVLEKSKIEQVLTKRESIYICKVTDMKVSGSDNMGSEQIAINKNEYFDILPGSGQLQKGYSAFDSLFDHITIKIHNESKPLSASERHTICHLFHESWTKKYRPYAIDEINDYRFKASLKGTAYDMETYNSIQHHFPICYGIGKQGLPASASAESKAKTKQLKAYLLFFEQFLANEQSQIANVSSFFDIDFDPGHQNTYFSQYPNDIPNVANIYAETSFKTNACVYQKAIWRKVKKVTDDETPTSLKGLKKKQLLQQLENWVCRSGTFLAYLSAIKNKPFPHELKSSDAETRAYLEMLYNMHFSWLVDGGASLFDKALVVSFAFLLKIEKKVFTPLRLVTSFIGHLKKMLVLEPNSDNTDDGHHLKDVQKMVVNIFDRLGKFKLEDRSQRVLLANFVEMGLTVISMTDKMHSLERKNRVYDHMLARFGEDFSAEPFLTSTALAQHTFENKTNHFKIGSKLIVSDALLQAKSNYLNRIGDISANSMKGESFARKSPNNPKTKELSGLEQVILAKTGIVPRENAEDGEGSETFYVVDHIMLRDFLEGNGLRYGFKFVDAMDDIVCETKTADSWCDTERQREERLQLFFESLKKPQALFQYDEDGSERLRSLDILTPDGRQVLASFAKDRASKEEVLELARLTGKGSANNGRSRLRELERIRAKGVHKVGRGHFGQRRLVYQVHSKNGTNKKEGGGIVGEDFFNLRISVVMPAETGRFKNDQFKSYMRALIIERVPSHIRLDMYFLTKKQMRRFKKTYTRWESLRVAGYEDSEPAIGLKKAAEKVYLQLVDLQREERKNGIAKMSEKQSKR